MSEKRLIIVIIVASAAILAGTLIFWRFDLAGGKYGTNPAKQPATEVKLGLSWVHEAQFAGEYYADQNGFYRQAGLKVDLIPYDNTDLVAKLVSGEYQFALLQGDELLKARSQLKPVVGLFVTYRVSPTEYFARKDSGIKTLADLKGKKAGVAYSEQIPLQAMLRSVGVDPAAVRMINREYSYGPLARGDYDIEAGWVFDIDSVKKAGVNDPVVLKAADHGANIFADIIATTQDMIDNHPDLVQRFISATVRGWRETLKDPKGNSHLTLNYDPAADVDHLESVLILSQPFIQPPGDTALGETTFVQWQAMYDTLRSQGYLDSELNLNDAYTNKFLK